MKYDKYHPLVNVVDKNINIAFVHRELLVGKPKNLNHEPQSPLLGASSTLGLFAIFCLSVILRPSGILLLITNFRLLVIFLPERYLTPARYLLARAVSSA